MKQWTKYLNLTHKAQSIGHHPEIILAGRRLNDNMGSYIVSQFVKSMLERGVQVNNAKILIMGLTLKENCPDLRNTRVVDIVAQLYNCNCKVDVYDPWVSVEEAKREYNITPIPKPESNTYDGIVLAVAHQQFRVMVQRIFANWENPPMCFTISSIY